MRSPRRELRCLQRFEMDEPLLTDMEMVTQALSSNTSLVRLCANLTLNDHGSNLGYVMAHHTRLQEIALDFRQGNNIGNQVSSFMHQLQSSKTLTTLKLNKWPSIPESGVKNNNPYGTLTAMTKLTHPCFTGDMTQHTWDAWIMSVLSRRTTLQRLDVYFHLEPLAGFSIGPSLRSLTLGIVASYSLRVLANFIRPLPHCGGLNAFFAHGRPTGHVDAASCRLVIDALAVKNSLQTVNIDSTFATYRVLPDFRKVLRGLYSMNTSGRAYVLNDPRNKIKAIMAMKPVKQNLHCMYHHLRMEPTIVGSCGKKKCGGSTTWHKKKQQRW